MIQSLQVKQSMILVLWGVCMPPQDTWINFTTSLLNGDKNSNYNINIASLYNTPIEDKKNYVDGNNSGFVSSTGVFGRRYYINGNTGDSSFLSCVWL
ncbi:MAG: hypothetical protein ACLUE2_05870 [Bacteroides cellulosilyticus]